MPTCTLQDCCCWCPCPIAGHCRSQASAGEGLPFLGRSEAPFLESLLLSLGPGARNILFVSFKVSCFPQSCGWSVIKSIDLQSQIPWRFPVPLMDSQVGKSNVGPRTFTTVRELLDILFSVLRRVTYLVIMGFYFIMVVPLLQSHCSFSFILGHGVCFWWVPTSSCQRVFNS